MLTMINDTETTGFPRKFVPDDHESQPHLVQLAFVTVEEDDICKEYFKHSSWETIIKCPIEIPEAASNVHGVTQEKSNREGISLLRAIIYFDSFLSSCDEVICFNAPFDLKILKIAYARANTNNETLLKKPFYCAMQSFKKYNARLGNTKYSLKEAYSRLVNTDGFEGAHSALGDVNATFAVWRIMKAMDIELVQIQ